MQVTRRMLTLYTFIAISFAYMLTRNRNIFNCELLPSIKSYMQLSDFVNVIAFIYFYEFKLKIRFDVAIIHFPQKFGRNANDFSFKKSKIKNWFLLFSQKINLYYLFFKMCLLFYKSINIIYVESWIFSCVVGLCKNRLCMRLEIMFIIFNHL